MACLQETRLRPWSCVPESQVLSSVRFGDEGASMDGASVRLGNEGVSTEDYDGVNALIERGYNHTLEAERARLLYQELGNEGLRIAQNEQSNNREGYQREFLDDQPLSHPREYWHIDGKLHSYPLRHRLTTVESGISTGERGGMTLRGFLAFQDMIVNSGHSQEDMTTSEASDQERMIANGTPRQENLIANDTSRQENLIANDTSRQENLIANDTPRQEVFLWYSPAGPGGNTPPFDKLYYEAGRLYVCFKMGDQKSLHFDVKIQEGGDVRFPVARFLEYVTGYYSDNVFDYLRRPVAAGKKDEFFEAVESFSQSSWAGERDVVGHSLQSQGSRGEDSEQSSRSQRRGEGIPLYVSQRDSKRRTTHTTGSVFAEMREAVERALERPTYRSADLSPDKPTDRRATLLDAAYIDYAYRRDILDYARAYNLREVTLYGCSTTSVGLSIEPSTNPFTSYSTASRMIGVIPSSEVYSDSPYKPREKKLYCTCPFCKKKVFATIKDGQIHCESKEKGGCGKFAPYKDK